jgi:hypothetical protein
MFGRKMLALGCLQQVSPSRDTAHRQVGRDAEDDECKDEHEAVRDLADAGEEAGHVGCVLVGSCGR